MNRLEQAGTPGLRIIVLACALLTAGCPAREAADPWQPTPLEEPAILCDQEALMHQLETMRRGRLRPNLRDLHSPEGSLSHFVHGCSVGVFRPQEFARTAKIASAILELAELEASPESLAHRLTLLALDRTRVALPESHHREPPPEQAAVVSVTGSGQIRVSSGEAMSVPVTWEDLVPFAASIAARPPPAVAGPRDLRAPGGRRAYVAIGPGDQVEIGEVGGPVAREGSTASLPGALDAALGQIGEGTEILVRADAGASYGGIVAVLDGLAETGRPLALRLASDAELVVEIGAGSDRSPAVALKADRELRFSSVARIVDALVQGGVGRLMLLTNLILPATGEIAPGTYPGGLPGGLALSLQGRRPAGFDEPRRAGRGPEPIEISRGRLDSELEEDADVVIEIPEAPPRRKPTGPIFVGGDVRAPVKVYAPQPQYTEIARKSRIQGVVIVRAIIDTQGNVTSVKVLKGLPMGLDDEAVKAIEQWRFEPATLDGEPVDVYYNLTVNFRLE